jgi:hypothetical protein
MKSSRYYQNMIQIVGSSSEIILFLSGFFLGKAMFVTAAILLALRLISKITISECMYNRFHAQIREGIKFPGKGGT